MNNSRSQKSLSIELFFISLTSLFFELIVIRWLSCDFISFMVFKTFPLATCFIGLGVGVAKGDDRLFKYAPIALLTFSIILYSMRYCGIGSEAFPSLGLYQWADFSELGGLFWLYVLKMMLSIVLLLAGPFAFMVTIGSRIGFLFNQHRPLTAYCIDIAGAITGSVTFALLSFLNAPPGAQVALVALLLMFYVREHCRPLWLAAASLVLSVALCLLGTPGGGKVYWSPYSRLEVNEITVPKQFLVQQDWADKSSNDLVGALIMSNHAFQQAFTRINEIKPNADGLKLEPIVKLSQFLAVRNNYYSFPYRLIKPKDILVLGAGAGSDICEAVRQKVDSIDGVEIDPFVLHLGHEYNPDYASPKVHLVCNDGRDYVNRCKKQYDLIIFACLDSSALSGSGSSVRTDSYIHTRENYQKCLSLLRPNGILVLAFGASVSGHSEWLRDKIYRTMESAAGYAPLVVSDQNATMKWPAYIFVSGEPVRKGLLAPGIENSFQPVTMPAQVSGRILEDDWPYMYIRSGTLDGTYLLMVLLIIAITLYAGRHLIFGKNTASDGQLFALGAAFMLLELQSISRLSLLYGTTWVTTSVVINGVLLMILVANFITVKWGESLKQPAMYALIALSLIVNYVLPTALFLSWDQQGGYTGHIVITLLTLLPIFVAGLIFATSFNTVKSPSRSFAFNLLGSVAGAMLEYLSTYFGIRNLLIIAFALYFVSYLCSRQIAPGDGSKDVEVKPDQ
jgi:SAM-dependent methyltransferase